MREYELTDGGCPGCIFQDKHAPVAVPLRDKVPIHEGKDCRFYWDASEDERKIAMERYGYVEGYEIIAAYQGECSACKEIEKGVSRWLYFEFEHERDKDCRLDYHVQV